MHWDWILLTVMVNGNKIWMIICIKLVLGDAGMIEIYDQKLISDFTKTVKSVLWTIRKSDVLLRLRN